MQRRPPALRYFLLAPGKGLVPSPCIRVFWRLDAGTPRLQLFSFPPWVDVFSSPPPTPLVFLTLMERPRKNQVRAVSLSSSPLFPSALDKTAISLLHAVFPTGVNPQPAPYILPGCPLKFAQINLPVTGASSKFKSIFQKDCLGSP